MAVRCKIPKQKKEQFYIVTNRAYFRQGMESVSYFYMTENNTPRMRAGLLSYHVLLSSKPLSMRWWDIIFSHSVHLKLGHRIHALSKICSAIMMILSPLTTCLVTWLTIIVSHSYSQDLTSQCINNSTMESNIQ